MLTISVYPVTLYGTIGKDVASSPAMEQAKTASPIGANMLRLLGARDISRYQLAKILGVPTNGVYQKVRDVKEPKISTLLKWSVSIGVDVNELVVGVNTDYDAFIGGLPRHTPVATSSSGVSLANKDGARGSSSATGVLEEQSDLKEAAAIVKRTTRDVVDHTDDERPYRTEPAKTHSRRVRRPHHRRSAR